MLALIDGDILRYEVGFGAETGWRTITEGGETIPQFDYVLELLDQKLNYIITQSGADDYQIVLSSGPSFRDRIATTRPYKGNRISNKPWHYDNLTSYMAQAIDGVVLSDIDLEPDDSMAIWGCRSSDVIVVSRDKDLRQVPCNLFSWEHGNQPSFGPKKIDPLGNLILSEDNKKLSGEGFKFFCAQLLMGDRVDNIPGLPKIGPKHAYGWLYHIDNEEALLKEVRNIYRCIIGEGWEKYLLEQGQLLWIVRDFDKDGNPKIWDGLMTR